MKTEYEIEYIELGNLFSKARKLEKLSQLVIDNATHQKIKEKILDSEAEEVVLARAEADDRIHWITLYGKKAASDLLTLGKVQPETMLEMSALSIEDFKEAVKIATITARQLNEFTIAAEKELNTETIPDNLV